MKRLWITMVLQLVLWPLTADARGLKEFGETFEVEPAQAIRITMPVAELEIEAAEVEEVRAELRVRCRWGFDRCGEILDDLSLQGRSSSRRLTLELVDLPPWKTGQLDIEGRIFVPKGNPLEIDMGVAELDLRHIQSDLRIDIGVGRVRLRVPSASVGEVRLDVGVGEAELIGSGQATKGRRSLLIGSEVYWEEGPGDSRIDIELGVGEVTVRLD